jgi:hypothetical protein
MSVTANLTTNVETITATITVAEETIVAEINTAARGPVGPSGVDTWDEIGGTAAVIPFEPGAAPTYGEGKLFYDSTDKSLTYYGDEPEAAMNIGRELWVRARNNSGATIANGKVVYISGASGQLPTIALARADALATSRVIGIATHDIEDNSFGYVTTAGEVKGLDTSAFSDGNVLYLSAATAGELTATAPTAPNRVIQVATVSHAHPSQGKLLCHPETDSVQSTGIADSTDIGRSLITAASASDARIALGAGATGAELFQAATAEAANAALNTITATKTSPTTKRLDTTIAADPDLQILLTSGIWLIEWVTTSNVNADSNWKFRISGPTHRIGSGAVLGQASSCTSNGWDTRLANSINMNTSLINDRRGGATQGRIIWATSTSGNLSFDWAQNISHDSDTIIYSGFIKATKIGD